MKRKSESETEINEKGGISSAIKARWDLIPPVVLTTLARVFWEGAQRYDDENWKLEYSTTHYNHMMEHLHSTIQTNNQKELDHFLCRAAMFYYMRLKEEEHNE